MLTAAGAASLRADEEEKIGNIVCDAYLPQVITLP
jgi:hypothetical protein